MLQTKYCPLKTRTVVLSLVLVLLLVALSLFCGCAQKSINRTEGQFPNVPAVLDQLAASPDEDFSEELNLTEDDNGTKAMSDLNGWSGYSEIDFSISSEQGIPAVEITADDYKEAETSYFVLPSGIVTKGNQVADTSNTYVTNLVSNPSGAEKAFCEKLEAADNFDKEHEVAQQILESCGINVNDTGQESQRYAKSSPLQVIDALLENKMADAPTGTFGSSYAITGESKTPEGKTLYFKINVSDGMSAFYLDENLGDEAYAYISIPDYAEKKFSASFRLSEPYQLDDPEPYGKQSESPIDSKDVFSYMASTSEVSTGSRAGKIVAYKSTDDPDTVFVLTIENDETWYVSFRAVVNGKIPEKLGEDVNGQGIISGHIYLNGEITGTDDLDDPHFQFKAGKEGIKVTCTDRITPTASEVEGFYYYDLSSALAN